MTIHWTQTAEGKKKLSQIAKAKHRSGVMIGGKVYKARQQQLKAASVASPVKSTDLPIDLKSAVVYLRQAQRAIVNRPASYAELLGQLALKVLLGEDH